MDIQEQLAILRERVAQVQGRAPAPGESRKEAPPANLAFVEELLAGEVRETSLGRYFESETLYPIAGRHGAVEIEDLLRLPHDFLEALSESSVPRCGPERWAFLDTETTGLAGGSGTYAFLIGIGSIEPEGFRVRQFFMRDYGEEPSQLDAVARYLARFDVLITYNGRSYDQPLLETRYRMCRAQHPFGRMSHLDLLCGARRLWKRRMENCRLTHLEREVLGVEREGDVAGSLIPYLYFEFVRTRRAARLVPVFQHNVLDILSLACLTAIVPEAYRNPETLAVRHGADLVGVAGWLARMDQPEQAARVLERAIEAGLPDSLLFPAILEVGLLRKKLGQWEAALASFTELAQSPNECRMRAWEELAKYYEHRERNCAMALEVTLAALAWEETAKWKAREARLRGRLAARRGQRSFSAGL